MTFLRSGPLRSLQSASQTDISAAESTSAFIYSHAVAISWVLLAQYIMQCSSWLTLLWYIRYHRRAAMAGDSTAARKLVLPSFGPLLWILSIASGFSLICVSFSLAFHVYPTKITSALAESLNAGSQFGILLALLLMMQKSVSICGHRRAVILSLMLSLYMVPVAWYAGLNDAPADQDFNFWLLLVTRSFVLVLLFYVAVCPPERANKQVLRGYCAFASINYGLVFTYTIAFYLSHAYLGLVFVYIRYAWLVLTPSFVWQLLKADTEYWRELGHQTCTPQTLFQHRTNSSQRMSPQGLHVVIEMQRKFVLDFTSLQIQQRIGVGTSAVVYRGRVNGKTPAAIKVYTPPSVNEALTTSFSYEAALRGALNHPNIVRFYGMCVSPPNICVVSELCHGSLHETTRYIAKQFYDTTRKQHLINLAYMIDAARGVAYLHSFFPPFVHRDLQPSNFLVDEQGNVKLTHFGESRMLSFRNGGDSHNHRSKDRARSTAATESASIEFDCLGDGLLSCRYGSTPDESLYVNTMAQSPSPGRSTSASETPTLARKHTIIGSPEFVAPEVIAGTVDWVHYGSAADVYSLSVTMWAILHPLSEKYPGSNRHRLRLFELVLMGERPAFDPSVHPALVQLISHGWQDDPRKRPSAETMVMALETMQQEMCGSFAAELLEELRSNPSSARSSDGPLDQHFTGLQMVQTMHQMQAVWTDREGVRLGNMLMDAGFLHHVMHIESFANDSELYFFDEEHIQVSHPFAMLESAESSLPNSEEEPSQLGSEPECEEPCDLQDNRGQDPLSVISPGPRISQLHLSIGAASPPRPSQWLCDCKCQKLGQRLDNQKASRRRASSKHKSKVSAGNLLTANLLEQELLAFYETGDRLSAFESAPNAMSM